MRRQVVQVIHILQGRRGVRSLRAFRAGPTFRSPSDLPGDLLAEPLDETACEPLGKRLRTGKPTQEAGGVGAGHDTQAEKGRLRFRSEKELRVRQGRGSGEVQHDEEAALSILEESRPQGPGFANGTFQARFHQKPKIQRGRSQQDEEQNQGGEKTGAPDQEYDREGRPRVATGLGARVGAARDPRRCRGRPGGGMHRPAGRWRPLPRGAAGR